MILSYIDFAIAVALVVLAFRVQVRSSPSRNSNLVFTYCLVAAGAALGIGAAYAGAFSGSTRLALLAARFAAVCVVASFVVVALLASSFPAESKRRYDERLALAAWAVLSFVILFTDRYLIGVSMRNGVLIRDMGAWYLPVTGAGFGLGVVSALFLFGRRYFLHTRIQRLQTAVAAIGLSVGYLLSFVLAVVLPLAAGLSWAYALMPAGALFLAASLSYALSVTRLFDPRAMARETLSAVLVYLPVGALAGAAVALLALPLREDYGPGASFSACLAIFACAYGLAAFLRPRVALSSRRQDSSFERLETGLSDIDFSQGRDAVVAAVLSLVQESFSCAAVNLLVSDADGAPAVAGSTNGRADGFPKRSAGIDFLLNNNVRVLLKTEIVANYDYVQVREELLDLFERYDADALVLAREGRTVVGALFLGAKRTGGDFTSRDFDELNRVYGKLFVAVYYLKHIAQESLVVTVDRELDFSAQIIQSIQENIDTVDHPAAEIASVTRSTRKLGGDFIDFIRLSPDRFVFVMGDLAGKGLNASMSMVILKSVVRTYVKETKDFKSLVVKTNAFIKANLPRGTFFAGVFGYFDLAEKSMYFVNCGVPVMYMLSSSFNAPVEMQGDGKVLGFVKNIEPYVTVRKAGLKSGDLLVMATDGLLDAESPRGARFGKERLQRAVLENRSLSAPRLIAELTDRAVEFVSGDLNDDLTILALRIR